MLREFRGKSPVLAPGVRMAENASVIGDVVLEEDVNLWYGAVLRADHEPIRIGRGSNIQDNVVAHIGKGFPLTVGADVTVGHGAILHGCTVEDGALIGMGAILLNGCIIGAGAMVAAGALVPQGMTVPPGHLAIGTPAKVVRPLGEDELSRGSGGAAWYRELAAEQLPVV